MRRLSAPSNNMPKFFDRGALIEGVSQFNIISFKTNIYTVSIKLIYKIVGLIVLWGIVRILYYLCIIIQYSKFITKPETKILEIIISCQIILFWLALIKFPGLAQVRDKNNILR